ncbi:hypothetical protein [Zooshikella sp. RANM57]|uniref:hypothetical protein n=1 Tax=Zooshikella sp. RANM57 TaxID=3425863 RepID=UPI003D6E76B5
MNDSSLLNNSQENPDLFWDISSITNKSKAIHFFQSVSSSFCVYSPTVEKIYSNFEVILPRDHNSGLIVLPNPFAFHDTFNRVNEEAIKSTGILLFPGEVFQRKGLIICLTQAKTKKIQHIELDSASIFLNRLYLRRFNTPFLPILLNGDLKEFKANSPYLHLHRFDPTAVTELSQFEIKSISNTINERFQAMIKNKTHKRAYI